MPRDNAGDERDVDGLSVQRGDASMTTQSPAQSAHPYIGLKREAPRRRPSSHRPSPIRLGHQPRRECCTRPSSGAHTLTQRFVESTPLAPSARPASLESSPGPRQKERLNPMPHYIEPAVFGGKHADIHCLATDKVNCVGQPVVAVVGTNLPDVLAALKLVKVGLRAAASRSGGRRGNAARGPEDRR